MPKSLLSPESVRLPVLESNKIAETLIKPFGDTAAGDRFYHHRG